MLDIVKKALRLTHDMLDDEIQMQIDACLFDMETSGASVDINNRLVQLAIITFVKSHFGLDNKNSSKYYRSYNSIKEKLKLVGE